MKGLAQFVIARRVRSSVFGQRGLLRVERARMPGAPPGGSLSCQPRTEAIAMRPQPRLDRHARCRRKLDAPVAQLDRAPDYESGGRTFESFRARHFARRISGLDR